MTRSEIYKKFYSPSTTYIYGRMYGNKYLLTNDGNGLQIKFLDKILKLNKKDIKIGADGESFIYVWGFPGPDYNIYKFSDYGETWAFEEKDFSEE